jgi:(2R)-sulfolactate sulfo-lyase subunit alpha
MEKGLPTADGTFKPSAQTKHQRKQTVCLTVNRIMKHGILLHEADDDVGVAVADLKKGASVGAVTLEGKAAGSVKLVSNVPLGHKVAMRELAKDKAVIKYGRPIGKAVQAIAKGAHVHIHNLKTSRWSL